jgi:hypothetical protein
MSAEALSVDAAISGYREAKVSKGQLIAALTLAGATAFGAAAFVSSIDSSHGTPVTPASHHVKQLESSTTTQSGVAMHQQHLNNQAGGR